MDRSKDFLLQSTAIQIQVEEIKALVEGPQSRTLSQKVTKVIKKHLSQPEQVLVICRQAIKPT
jgi:hypothetical protein